jgi:hypothetical protein
MRSARRTRKARRVRECIIASNGFASGCCNATEATPIAYEISRIKPKRETSARLYKIDHLSFEVMAVQLP